MVSLEHIWSVNEKGLSWLQRQGLSVLKRCVIAWEGITKNHIMSYASALTYSSMLAAVPVMAIIFAIARGFGFDAVIETKLRTSLEGNPDIADTILYFVDSYLQHTKGGVFIGIGLIFLLYTLLSLTQNIEQVFNTIWYVNRSRTIYRQVVDYFSVFLFLPFVLIITSGLSIFLQTFRTLLPEMRLLSDTMTFILHVSPVIFAVLVFMLLFKMMPNTSVKWRHTIWPSILTGVVFMAVEWIYVHYQLKLSAYNAIYGSFAALPLFMLWMQISWTICLFGAELCYTNQNLDYYDYDANAGEISHRYRLMLCALLMSRICKRFAEGRKPYSVLELREETKIPIRFVNDLLYELIDAHLLIEVTSDEKGEESRFMPSEDLGNLTLGTMVDRLEARGRWKIDLDVSELLSQEWGKAIAARGDYLKAMRGICLQNL